MGGMEQGFRSGSCLWHCAKRMRHKLCLLSFLHTVLPVPVPAACWLQHRTTRVLLLLPPWRRSSGCVRTISSRKLGGRTHLHNLWAVLRGSSNCMSKLCPVIGQHRFSIVSVQLWRMPYKTDSNITCLGDAAYSTPLLVAIAGGSQMNMGVLTSRQNLGRPQLQPGLTPHWPLMSKRTLSVHERASAWQPTCT